MAKRPSHRLGIGGALVPPGPNMRAQWLFLEAVRRCVPEAMEALTAIAPTLPDGNPSTGAYWDAEAPLRTWCETWGFVGVTTDTDRRDWLLTVARRTAAYLRTKDPAWPDAWAFISSYRGVGTEHVSPLRWQPDEETEAQFRARVDTYIGHVKAAAGERGWTNPPEKRKLEHLEWLARYQVGGWTEAQVSEHYQDENGSPDVPGVSRALNDTARLIGLKLRFAQGRTASTEP